ncbi:MAG: Fur family transcriptional regulator [Anaerovoracaceae bacterium]
MKEGVNVSKQRDLVLDIIKQSHTHPTAEEIFFEARKKMPSIALGTIYRNINALNHEGAIRRVTIPEAPDRFDTVDIPHDHLICQRCGRLKDISLHGVREAIRETVGEDIISYELNAYYLCDDCKKEQEKQEVQNERIKGN